MSGDSERENSAIRNEADTQSAIRTLRRFVRPRSAAIERCELCSAELMHDHQHLVEPQTRQLLCACEACAILFSGQTGTKYRRVPRRVQYLSDFKLTDAQWEALMIPIGLAFFMHSSAAGRTVALYPSPAGATESLLDLEAWAAVAQSNPVLKEIEPDTEALLVNRVGSACDYYIVPIDECYKLVGLIRANWHGLSGGTEVWAQVARFFGELKERGERQ